MLRNFL